MFPTFAWDLEFKLEQQRSSPINQCMMQLSVGRFELSRIDQTKGFLYNHMVKNNPILPLQQLLNVCALLQNVGKVITTREQWQTASSKGIFPSEFSCGLSIDQTTGIQRWIGWTGGTLKKDPGLDEG